MSRVVAVIVSSTASVRQTQFSTVNGNAVVKPDIGVRVGKVVVRTTPPESTTVAVGVACRRIGWPIGNTAPTVNTAAATYRINTACRRRMILARRLA